MIEDDDEPDQSRRRLDLLNKIAEALNCSVSDLASSRTDDLSQTAELFSLWLTIDNEQDREKLLSAARRIAAKS